MESSKKPSQLSRPPSSPEPAGPSRCPHCGSYTIPIRGLLRCMLCSFVFCEGCESNENGGQP
jgi:hypothetical protein